MKSTKRGRPGREGGEAAEEPGGGPGGQERLQKLLARAGYGSRRACEELILEGRVAIDGQVVRELGTKADPASQAVTVGGKRLRLERPVYYLVNKPRGVLCTSADPEGRPTVLDLVPGERRRVFAVGRLDQESRGAVILTNDGSFTNLLTHPRYGVEKTYLVRVRGELGDDAVEQLRRGVWLSEGRTLPARVWVVKRRPEETRLGVAISEGKNRQVRRMLAKVGFKVLALTRTRIGPITLKGIGDGGSRELTRTEVDELRALARRNAQSPPTKATGRRSRQRSPGKPDPAYARALGAVVLPDAAPVGFAEAGAVHGGDLGEDAFAPGFDPWAGEDDAGAPDDDLGAGEPGRGVVRGRARRRDEVEDDGAFDDDAGGAEPEPDDGGRRGRPARGDRPARGGRPARGEDERGRGGRGGGGARQGGAGREQGGPQGRERGRPEGREQGGPDARRGGGARGRGRAGAPGRGDGAGRGERSSGGRPGKAGRADGGGRKGPRAGGGRRGRGEG